jgi:hypothetical protein
VEVSTALLAESFSLDQIIAIVGIVLAVFAIAIGAGITVAMDAKTKGEFRFAAGCFIFSALMLVCSIGVWHVSTSLGLGRRAGLSLLAVSAIVVGAFEAVRWTQARHTRASGGESGTIGTSQPQPTPITPQPTTSPMPAIPTHIAETGVTAAPHVKKAVSSPYRRTESFIIDVPYYGGVDGFPIRMTTDSTEYPLADAYYCIGSALVNYVPANVTQINQIEALDTIDKRSQAIVQALRFCIIESVLRAERGSSKFGFNRKKGSIAEYNPAIIPPKATDHDIVPLISALPFPHGQERRITFLYQHRPLPVPEGSTVELGVEKMGKNDWMDHTVFKIKHPQLFELVLGVAPINAAVGLLPEWFVETFKPPDASQYVTYSFAITMRIEIQRTSDNATDVEDLMRWSDDLWKAIRQRYDINRK